MALWLPHRVFLTAAVIGFVSTAIVIWAALSPPWLGLTLKPDVEANAVRLVAVDADGPAKIGTGQLVSVSRDGKTIALDATDVMEEPDLLPTYAEARRFFTRQSEIAEVLKGSVTLTVRTADGPAAVTATPAQRPIGDLAVAFWVQVITGLGSLLIGCWVLALRPADLATRLFALSGAMMMVCAHAAAVYSSRELAIDGGLFRLLSALNHTGALGFGAAMIGLFLVYPRQLVAPKWLLVLPAVFVPWLLLDISHLAPAPTFGSHLPVAIEMLLIVAGVLVQWFFNRKDPHGRAALRWLGLSVVVFAGAFILLIVAPNLFDQAPQMEQGLALGFFLLVYAGIALGVGRYRLFDLDDWAFRVTFYTGGVLLLLALDAVLIMLLNFQRDVSFSLSLLAIAFVYLPLRDKLWTRLVARRRVESHELFRSVIDITLASSAVERAKQWTALLQRLFDPLAIEPAAPPASQVETRNEGLEMVLPATGDAPSLVLRFPWRGTRLFGSAHVQLATHLAQLMRHAEESRVAYERGSLEERRRIARDLHDDVGARLLSGLHKTDVGETHRVLRDALADIRTVVSGLSSGKAPLGQVVAALRHETGERLDAAGLNLDWPLSAVDDSGDLLGYRVQRDLVSVHREAISNVIRHAKATTVTVSLELRGGALRMSVTDDGIGLPSAEGRTGSGLAGMTRRLSEAGGSLAVAPVASGTCLQITIPLEAESAAPDAALAPQTP